MIAGEGFAWRVQFRTWRSWQREVFFCRRISVGWMASRVSVCGSATLEGPEIVRAEVLSSWRSTSNCTSHLLFFFFFFFFFVSLGEWSLSHHERSSGSLFPSFSCLGERSDFGFFFFTTHQIILGVTYLLNIPKLMMLMQSHWLMPPMIARKVLKRTQNKRRIVGMKWHRKCLRFETSYASPPSQGHFEASTASFSGVFIFLVYIFYSEKQDLLFMTVKIEIQNLIKRTSKWKRGKTMNCRVYI